MKLTTKDNKRYQMVPVPPGLLQYYVKKETIVNLNIDKTNNTSYKEGYELECHTNENLLRLIPHTSTGQKNKDNWRVLLVIKK